MHRRLLVRGGLTFSTNVAKWYCSSFRVGLGLGLRLEGLTFSTNVAKWYCSSFRVGLGLGLGLEGAHVLDECGDVVLKKLGELQLDVVGCAVLLVLTQRAVGPHDVGELLGLGLGLGLSSRARAAPGWTGRCR